MQVRQKVMRRRWLDGPGIERMSEFEERTRIIAERFDVKEIFRTRETEFLFGGRGWVIDLLLMIEYMNTQLFHAFYFSTRYDDEELHTHLMIQSVVQARCGSEIWYSRTDTYPRAHECNYILLAR